MVLKTYQVAKVKVGKRTVYLYFESKYTLLRVVSLPKKHDASYENILKSLPCLEKLNK